MQKMHKAVQKEIVNLTYRGIFFFFLGGGGGGGRNLFGLSLLDIKLFWIDLVMLDGLCEINVEKYDDLDWNEF